METLFGLFVYFIHSNSELSLAESERMATYICENAYWRTDKSERARSVCSEVWDKAGFIY